MNNQRRDKKFLHSQSSPVDGFEPSILVGSSKASRKGDDDDGEIMGLERSYTGLTDFNKGDYSTPNQALKPTRHDSDRPPTASGSQAGFERRYTEHDVYRLNKSSSGPGLETFGRTEYDALPGKQPELRHNV